MAIDPSKLQAFASKGKPQPPPDPKGGGEEQSPDSKDGEGDNKYAELIPLMEEYQDDLEQCYEELDGDMLADPEAELAPEDMQIMKEGFDALDPGLKKAMQRLLPGIDASDAADLADQLGDEDKTSDPDKLAGYLVRLGDYLAANGGGKPAKQGGGKPDEGGDDVGDDMGDG